MAGFYSAVDNAAYAAIAFCALVLVDDEILDADYVKRLRQRERENSTR